jgi:hypothetical protein
VRLQIFPATLLFLIFSVAAFAQEIAEITKADSNKAAKARLFDVYEETGELSLESRFNSLFLGLLQQPDYQSRIIVYRGADD